MGLINQDNYCEKVDRNNLNKNISVHAQMNFLTDYNYLGLVRTTMNLLGQDLLPAYVSKDMPLEDFNSRVFKIPEDADIIFTKKTRFHYFHEFGKHLFC
jgi:hypothetical protein